MSIEARTQTTTEQVSREATIGDRAAFSWVAVMSMQNDAAATIGKSLGAITAVTSEDSDIYAEVAGITQRSQVQIMRGLLTVNNQTNVIEKNITDNAIRQYLTFFNRYATEHEIEEQVDQAYGKFGKHQIFFLYLMDQNPLVGTAAIVLYDRATREIISDTQPERPYARWYIDSIDAANETYGSITDVFKNLQTRNKKKKQSEVVGNFFDAFQSDVLLNLAEAVSLANCMALHIQQKDCAVYMSSIQVGTRPSEYPAAVDSVLSLWDRKRNSNNKKTILERYSRNVYDYNVAHKNLPRNGNHVLLPLYTSFIDIPNFFYFYKDYWKQVARHVTSPQLQVESVAASPEEYRIISPNDIRIMGRSVLTSIGQARLAINGRNRFSGFNVRVDKERYGLGLDIGRVESEHIVAYMREVLAEDAEKDFVMTYSQIVTNHGAVVTPRKLFYPSIFRSDARVTDSHTGNNAPLTIGNRAAMMVALAINAGYELGLRGEENFSYHAREKLCEPPFHARFQEIVDTIKEIFV